jgi:hypothetical protein
LQFSLSSSANILLISTHGTSDRVPEQPDAAYGVPNFAQRQVEATTRLRKFSGIDLRRYLQDSKSQRCALAPQKRYGSFRLAKLPHQSFRQE